MKKNNSKTITLEDTKHLEDFIKKYEYALKSKSKDIRLTIEEASLIVSTMVKMFLSNKKGPENSTEKKENNELIKVDLDFGYFKKK